MPRSAASKAPFRVLTAPVNAPRSWPKSSLSTRLSGSAAQLMATNGPDGSRPEPVEVARDQLLAGPALADDQHLARHRRDPGDRLAQLRHGRAAADQRGLPAELTAKRAHSPRGAGARSIALSISCTTRSIGSALSMKP